MEPISFFKARQSVLWAVLSISIIAYNSLELTSRVISAAAKSVSIQPVTEAELYYRVFIWLIFSIMSYVSLVLKIKINRILQIIFSFAALLSLIFPYLFLSSDTDEFALTVSLFMAVIVFTIGVGAWVFPRKKNKYDNL